MYIGLMITMNRLLKTPILMNNKAAASPLTTRSIEVRIQGELTGDFMFLY